MKLETKKTRKNYKRNKLGCLLTKTKEKYMESLTECTATRSLPGF